ncbi:DUF1428 domain-containing protein [Halomonas heilongjiangensis]|uniref:DUF1428 domain-containing protein n=1 Tax=Halomonas heilongjiangensis TaxID=1387883 RepID=A0A2N7TMM4_9GAMM|nr:DUF1428 domain-containing protein [Halomonas heilongjiangensis]PMR69439.1 DUF1428 domain-containing protein [Halomonas heilongjiangensis]PXX89909.1 RNA signal recognition particle [Halomonas heilongjiangensis]
MSYVDAFVLPVPLERLDDYLRLARHAGEIWKEYGALEYVECVADDVKPGERTSFPRSVELEPGETVVFAWVRYATREDRNRILELVMNDPRLADMLDHAKLPFDAKRLFWGGFMERIRL